jgi:hypothetical protein
VNKLNDLHFIDGKAQTINAPLILEILTVNKSNEPEQPNAESGTKASETQVDTPGQPELKQ